MALKIPDSDIFVPDGQEVDAALKRTTHLGIGAHQDDLEFAAFHGIAECFEDPRHWFTGVICTSGAGSPREGPLAEISERSMIDLRRKEQRKAALIGEYSAVIQLPFSSEEAKNGKEKGLEGALKKILRQARPRFVYLHNPADKHDTHVACFLRSIAALRGLPAKQRPERVYGCEGWRDLDWLPDQDKVALSTSARPNLQAALNGLFDSQISGGKRYDLAVAGRRFANATFHQSHHTDSESGITWAMDLTPLVRDDSLSIEKYTLGFIERLRDDVRDRLKKLGS